LKFLKIVSSERLKANPNERASQFQTDQIDAVLKGRVLISNDITDLDQALIVMWRGQIFLFQQDHCRQLKIFKVNISSLSINYGGNRVVNWINLSI